MKGMVSLDTTKMQKVSQMIINFEFCANAAGGEAREDFGAEARGAEGPPAGGSNGASLGETMKRCTMKWRTIKSCIII